MIPLSFRLSYSQLRLVSVKAEQSHLPKQWPNKQIFLTKP